MPIRLLVLLILGISACKARKQASQIKDEAGRNQPRLESGPSIPTKGRSLFDLAMHRTSNPAGKDNVPFPFESLDKYLGSVTSLARDPNGENKKTSALLIPVGRSLQRFASEPDFFRFPRIVLSPTSWFDASSGIPISLESKVYVAFAPLAKQLEVISFNESLGRFEFQIVEDYVEGKKPRLRYADRALCVSCHQNQGPIFSSEPWNETNFNIQVASLIAASTGSEKYFGLPVRQTEADTDSGANDSFALNIRVDNASDILAMNVLWKSIGSSFKGDPISFRAKLLQTMLLDSLQIEPASKANIIELDEYIAKTFPKGFPLTDGIFSTRFPLGALGDSPEGKIALEKLVRKETDFLFNRSEESNKLLEILANSIKRDLRDLPPVGQSLGAARVNDTGGTEPTEVFDAALFFGVFRSAFRSYGMDSLREVLNVDRSNGVEKISKIISIMEVNARRTKMSLLTGNEPFNLYQLHRELRIAAGMPTTATTWMEAKDLPTPIGPDISSGLKHDQIKDETLRQVFSSCGSCHVNEFDGIPAFLAGKSEVEVTRGIAQYKQIILDRLAAKDDSVMPPLGTPESSVLERFPAERRTMIQWVKNLPQIDFWNTSTPNASR